jgi:CTP:molybdopterin cytidylyltransferase MocA
MDVIITAGGIPRPEEPLFPATQGRPKAMVDIAGKPMIQWLLDALSAARSVDNIVVVGLTEKSGLKCTKKIYYVPNQGKMVENLQAGANKALEINKKARQVLLASSDIPGVTAEMVDWLAGVAAQTDEDIYYTIVPRETMEKRYPGSKRTFTKLKDMEVCGGDLNVARITFLLGGNKATWDKITDARKSPLKQAALVGFDTAFLLLTGQLSLDRAVENITTRLQVTGRAIVSPYAEIGMDVDKPHQLAIMRADMAKQVRKANLSAKSSPQGKRKAPAAAKRTAATSSLKGASSLKGRKAAAKKAAAKPSPKGTASLKGKKPAAKAAISSPKGISSLKGKPPVRSSPKGISSPTRTSSPKGKKTAKK